MASKQPWPEFGASHSPIEVLVKLSRYYGADPEIVLSGGGNTSVKIDDRLYVKASGQSLATIDADGFVAMDRKKLNLLVERQYSDDVRQREEQFKRAILSARLEPEKSQRPSVECILHSLLAGRFVFHTHPTYVNMLTCCTAGERLAGEMFADQVLWTGGSVPGLMLAKALARALQEYAERTGRDCPEAVLMQNHGLVVCGDGPAEILERTERIVTAIRRRLEATPAGNVFGKVARLDATPARQLVDTIGPALRALLAAGENLQVVAFDNSDVVMKLAGAEGGAAVASGGALIPDHVVYCTSPPLWFEPHEDESTESLVHRLRQAVDAHAGEAGSRPKVVLVRGLGLFAAGDDFAAAETVRQVYLDAIRVLAGARRLGGIRYMTDEQRKFVETWEVEAYRRKVAAGEAARGRATGRVALVTGAAQGFGLEIARDFAAQGGHVVLTDINGEGVRKAAEELNDRPGQGRAFALEMDVTDSDSIAEAIHQTVRTYGGFDVLISNAGVLKAGSVKTQAQEEFDSVTSVNYRGYFLCVQNAAPVLAIQHLARSDYLSDIIQINSKSGLVGSNRNAAYAGSKFGGLGLTQSFAMELIADGIKVNAICPGNFFDGPLWSDPDNGLFVQYLRTGKVPGAKTIEDVRRAYEAKVPMGRGCRTEDLMKAIYYLMEQRYETGQALPVTGGQVMLS